MQSLALQFLRSTAKGDEMAGARSWSSALGRVRVGIVAGVALAVAVTVVGGSIVFAIGSSLHSSLILAYSQGDDVSLDAGFYDSTNAAGRLVGPLLSGPRYLAGGLDGALWGSSAFVAVAWYLTLGFPPLVAPPVADVAGAAHLTR